MADLVDAFNELPTEKKWAVGIAGGLTGLLLVRSLIPRSKGMKSVPGSFDLSGGSIPDAELQKEFLAYSANYSKEPGSQMLDKTQTVHLVDVFYSLVTDLYEWGWGQSFHFSPKLPGRNWRVSEIAHEARIPAALHLSPGANCLDLGCGVGGPMRTIATTSGCKITGITINEYQVTRCKIHNSRAGLDSLTKVVRGDFLNLPFPDNSFDGAYAIEATCHAPKLELVYAEAFRILKPGCMFLSYEWVTTPKFDANNTVHQKCIGDINYGNGLPDMRTWKEAEDAGKAVGFELVQSIDLAIASPVCGNWCDRLRIFRVSHHTNQFLVDCLDFVGLAPKGLKQVHAMLVMTAGALIDGGISGIFTPMQMLVFKKPLN
jgi:24-methylenesterol C-methyltransferase